NQIPDFRNAYDRGDTSEALRIFTHITLGAAMAGLGLQHAATGESIPTTEGPVKRAVYEGYRRTGESLDRLQGLRQWQASIEEAGTKLYQGGYQQNSKKTSDALKQHAASSIQEAL